MRYQYWTIEVGISDREIDTILAERSKAGWRLHSAVPIRRTKWSGLDPEDTSVVRMIFEKESNDE